MTSCAEPSGSVAWDTERVAMHVTQPSSWRQEISSLLEEGGRFLSLYAGDLSHEGADIHPATDGSPTGGVALRAAFATPGGVRVLTCPVPPVGVPSVVDLVPAAAWDEREAYDGFRVAFPGHHPLRPLVKHDLELRSWTVPVKGHDPYQVAVGPIHAGIIESGHFRFHVVGERILHLDVRLFYKHRGLERAAVGRSPREALALAQRACGACAVSNSLAFAHAYESGRGLRPTAELSRVRTILSEFERLYNHLNDIGAACAGVGFALGSMTFAALKERVHRLNAQLTGHRFLFSTIRLGESTLAVDDRVADEVRQELRDLTVDARRAWHEVLFNGSVQDRFVGVGELAATDALAFGVVGPSARASGVARDARSHSPRLLYPDFSPAALRHSEGDVASRVNMRALEVDSTLALLDWLLTRGFEPAGSVAATPPSSVGVGAVESPRGESTCILEMNGNTVARVRLRTASYANWPAVAHAAVGSLLPDFPLINKSFELCYSCSDR